MDNYIINKNTMVIIGIDEKFSKIIERDNEFEVFNSAKSIIENSCLYYGSSYKGRVESSSNILDSNYKVPILIEKENNVVFFPTISPDSNICMWISISEIEKVIVENTVTFLLKNNKKLTTNLSKYSVENQMFKSYNLANVMKDRNL